MNIFYIVMLATILGNLHNKNCQNKTFKLQPIFTLRTVVVLSQINFLETLGKHWF